jgi:polysaccharide export outer membrane protein
MSRPVTCSVGKYLLRLSMAAVLGGLAACGHQLPSSGPSRRDVEDASARPGAAAVQIVDIDAGVAQALTKGRRFNLFSETLAQRQDSTRIGRGDIVEVNIWEAPPATLFGGGAIDPRSPSTVRATTLPEQMVDRDGFIAVPFVGRIQVEGRTPYAVATDIAERLRGKANQPEVLVRTTRNNSSTVTVVGDVANSTRMPLTSSGERLLDALAAAGGVRQPVNKMTVQLTRGKQHESLPLDLIIRDPEQNVPLQPGDVVTAMFQPFTFTALGATGKNEEVAFEAQGITLAQALARAGGLNDARSDARGVFVFRFERSDALEWPRQPLATTSDGLVPVIYRLDLRDPASFFVMQTFPMNNKDVVYVSNAPVAELQKFLNLVFSLIYPVINVYQVVH